MMDGKAIRGLSKKFKQAVATVKEFRSYVSGVTEVHRSSNGKYVAISQISLMAAYTISYNYGITTLTCSKKEDPTIHQGNVVYIKNIYIY